jgi:hypothetical protein
MKHESVLQSKKEMIIKENAGYRVRLEKWEVTSPKGLFNIDIIQESLNDKGEVNETSTYNFFMTKEEIQSLAYGLTV